MKAIARLLTTLAFAGFAASAWAQSGAPIKVGAFLAMTGGATFLGDPQAKTLRQYVERINKSGGVLGRPLELVLYDSQGDARQAVTLVRRLIESDKVDILIGGTTTGETMAVAPLVDEARITLLSLSGGNVVVEPVKRWIFKTANSDRNAIRLMYADMAKRGLREVALLGGSGGFDQSCRAEAKGLAGKMGINLVADETYAPSDTDMTPQLSRISGSGAKAIVNCGFGAPTVIVTRNYKQLGVKAPMYFTHGVGSQQFIDGAAGAAEGVRVTVPAVLVAEELPSSDRQHRVVSEYVREYQAAHREKASGFGSFAYDALVIAVEAMKRANSTDKAKVRDTIEATRDFVGLNGVFNLSAQDHMGLDESGFRMATVSGSSWRILK